MPRCSNVLGLFLLASLVAPGQTGGFWGDLYEDGRPVPLAMVLASPESYVGRSVPVIVQVKRVGELDHPLAARFDRGAYLSFSAWADEAPLWDKEAYGTEHPFFFVPRESPVATGLAGASIYSRWMLSLVVVELYEGRPWFLVESARRQDEAWTEASLIRTVKANTLAGIDRFEAAAREYRASDADGLPKRVRLFLLEREALAWGAVGKNALALAAARKGLALAGDDAAWTALVTQLTGLATKRPGPTELEKGPVPVAVAGTEGVSPTPERVPK